MDHTARFRKSGRTTMIQSRSSPARNAKMSITQMQITSAPVTTIMEFTDFSPPIQLVTKMMRYRIRNCGICIHMRGIIQYDIMIRMVGILLLILEVFSLTINGLILLLLILLITHGFLIRPKAP
ncbi:MAG: hypothetical protein A2Y62_03420 [Candidatus Fischerbacteria bacterium RBG_13_37_8]|uniref:Uncharacterized protein n=1 Tax=Candidatus Fischerbacteria bacterium RBG_13_37_8 TaxID=1817863 RepID=A0A1F5VK09_9BACT|nr:MAG: hypothetical protein A2Y62_03420 [Candidatus Fischerbacteria bacterium RBG_13_37_8]